MNGVGFRDADGIVMLSGYGWMDGWMDGVYIPSFLFFLDSLD
jgi:hypothetical protein